MSGSTAEPFNALGRGNGFPFCLLALDVSTYAHVAPLTLEQAMRVFWLMENILCFSSASYNAQDGVSSITLAASVSDLNREQTPEERVCDWGSDVGKSATDEDSGVDVNVDMTWYNPRLSTASGLRRLFVGDEHIGFGWPEVLRLNAVDVIGEAYYWLQSFFDSEEAGWDYYSLTLDGIPFVSRARAVASSPSTNTTSATHARAEGSEGLEPTGSQQWDSHVGVTGLEFFQINE